LRNEDIPARIRDVIVRMEHRSIPSHQDTESNDKSCWWFRQTTSDEAWVSAFRGKADAAAGWRGS